MPLEIREGRPAEAVKIATLLRTSLNRGVEGKFKVNSPRLLEHTVRVLNAANGFSRVLVNPEGVIVGCFMAELIQHEYCDGYIAKELGVFIDDQYRGGRNFERMLKEFDDWADSKPDVLLKVFTIGQLGATTPYVRAVLKRHGFSQGDEGYFKT